VHLLVDLACAQDDVEMQYADTESKDDRGLEQCHKLPSDKADVHQFVQEQNELN
jgi:hypothetical protein